MIAAWKEGALSDQNQFVASAVIAARATDERRLYYCMLLVETPKVSRLRPSLSKLRELRALSSSTATTKKACRETFRRSISLFALFLHVFQRTRCSAQAVSWRAPAVHQRLGAQPGPGGRMRLSPSLWWQCIVSLSRTM